jgi:hypothetical protein
MQAAIKTELVFIVVQTSHQEHAFLTKKVPPTSLKRLRYYSVVKVR